MHSGQQLEMLFKRNYVYDGYFIITIEVHLSDFYENRSSSWV